MMMVPLTSDQIFVRITHRTDEFIDVMLRTLYVWHIHTI